MRKLAHFLCDATHAFALDHTLGQPSQGCYVLKEIDQFLLVPYYGACIHVPPPPANQTVHVVTRDGKAYRGELFDAVWVTGTLRVEPLSSDLAEAGYRLENATVAPYEEDAAGSP